MNPDNLALPGIVSIVLLAASLLIWADAAEPPEEGEETEEIEL